MLYLKHLHHFTVIENIKEIKKDYFKKCRELNSISIPISITNIETGTFNNCTYLYEITCDPKWLPVLNNKKIEYVYILDGVKTIDSESFKKCKQLERLKIPLSVETIDESAFEKCKKLTYLKCHPKWFNLFDLDEIRDISIPDNVEEIKREEMKFVKECRYISLPFSITSIEEDTFKDFECISSLKCDPKWLQMFNKDTL